MKDEIQRIYNRYFSENCKEVKFFGNSKRIEKVISHILNITPFEHPDGYSVLENDVLILEHFEFDSSNNSKRKGSQQKRSESILNDKLVNAPFIGNSAIIHDTVSADYTMESYKSNFLKHYSHHYSEIPEYKKTLSEKGIIQSSSVVTTLFFIEDTSIFGSHYPEESWEYSTNLLFLTQCDFFLDIFENSPELDCVLFGCQVSNDYFLWYIDHDMIASYRDNVIDTNKITLCNFTPHYIGTKTIVNNIDRFGNKVLCNPTVKLNKGKCYPLIDIEKITPGIKYVTSEERIEYVGQGGAKFEDHDVLMARITPCLENGKIAIAYTDVENGIGSTELFVFRGMEGISDTDYIYYLLNMPFMRQQAVNSMTGTSGRQRADLEFIKKIRWNFPDIENQRKIASILSNYDSFIEINYKRIKILEQMAENLYKEWFVRFRFPGYEKVEFENGLPKGWKVRKIVELVKRLPFGKRYKADDAEKDGNVIIIDQSLEEYVGFHNNEPSHIASVEKPIYLFGDHSCKYQLMITPFSLSENVVPFIGQNDVLTTYLYYLTHGSVETTEYKRHWSEFVSKKVLVAPMYLQQQFVDMVNGNLLLIQRLKQQNRNLTKQRDLLLPRLMSGKLEVR